MRSSAGVMRSFACAQLSRSTMVWLMKSGVEAMCFQFFRVTPQGVVLTTYSSVCSTTALG